MIGQQTFLLDKWPRPRKTDPNSPDSLSLVKSVGVWGRDYLNHTSATYKDKLKSLKLLPLMYLFKLNDILLYISYLKDSNSNLPILNELSFSSAQTRSSTFSKLPHKPVNSSVRSISFVSRFPCLWNALAVINTSSPLPSIKQKLITHFWTHFDSHFDPSTP